MRMIVKPYNWRLDAFDINQIWKEHHSQDFSIPSVDGSITNLVVRSDNSSGNIIAFGMVKVLAEAILVMDMNASARNRTQALKVLFMEAFRACRERKIEQMHVSVSDPDFAELLKKHYGFEDCKGQMLVVEV
jgi:hypothetical protein